MRGIQKPEAQAGGQKQRSDCSCVLRIRVYKDITTRCGAGVRVGIGRAVYLCLNSLTSVCASAAIRLRV